MIVNATNIKEAIVAAENFLKAGKTIKPVEVSELLDLMKTLHEAAGLLKRMEWYAKGLVRECGWCAVEKGEQHRADCILGDFLRKWEEVGGEY